MENPMNDVHAGSCLCGQVRYEVQGVVGRFYLCHCSHCRKDTGSAHAANLFVPGGELRWRAGVALVRHFQLPGTRHGRSFCSHCGSALPQQPEGGNLVVLPAGGLDAPLGRRPDAHIFAGSRADWDHEFERLPSFDRLPG